MRNQGSLNLSSSEPAVPRVVGINPTDRICRDELDSDGARLEVKQQAHYVTSQPGGSGAVREVIELILKAQGLWDEILKHYEIS